jgi:putative endonuclease
VANHNDLGQQGEKIAEKHLLQNGYEILDRNFRYKRDEIDLIAQKGEEIVFVEVKTRANDYLGEPEEAVTKSKQKRIIAVAHHYLIENHIEMESRFDIIAIILNSQTVKVNHIENAFQPLW